MRWVYVLVCSVHCALFVGGMERQKVYVLESNEVFLVIQQNSLYSLLFMVLIGIISISVASLRILGLRSWEGTWAGKVGRNKIKYKIRKSPSSELIINVLIMFLLQNIRINSIQCLLRNQSIYQPGAVNNHNLRVDKKRQERQCVWWTQLRNAKSREKALW